MSELVMGIIMFVIYILPFRGVVPLSEREFQIMDAYKAFIPEVNVSEAELVSMDGNSNMIGEDIPTLYTLGSLDNNQKDASNKGTSSSKDFTDIDINSLRR